MPELFCERLIASCERHSDRVAMRIVGDDTHVYTFGDLLRMILSVRTNLIRHGVHKGDRVAVIGENHPNWAVAYLATLCAGAVCVPLDPHGEIDTITNFIENSEAKLAFVSNNELERFQAVQSKLDRNITTVAWTTDEQVADAANVLRFSDWLIDESNDRSFDFPAGEDTALLIYTSGTTGTPKGVPLTHGNIVAELDAINEVLHLSEQEKILSLLPLFHAYLQIVNLWVATTYGIEAGYLKELSPAALGDAMRSFKPTILTTVPRLWYIFHKKIFDAVEAKSSALQAAFRAMLAINGTSRKLFGVNLGKKFFGEVHESFGGNLRVAISAGSRFDEAVAADFHKLGFTIIQGYGLTETSGAATATYEADNRIGSVGKPMKGTEIRIDSPDKDGVGEVLIRGGVVFSGYYRNPEATAEAFTDDGWFRSGDLGKFDSDGHLYIVGRAKDVIVLPSGKNVHPEDIETHYLKCPLVEELAILGVQDDKDKRAGAEKLIAVVVPDFEYLRSSNIANSKEAIRHDLDNLGRSLPEYQRVRDYVIRRDALPRTATRKIKRFQLRKEIEQNGHLSADIPAKGWQLEPAEREMIESPVGTTVTAIIRNSVKDAPVLHPSMNLEIDLGLDSLSRAETFAALENAFSTEFEGDEAARALTIKDVIDLVQKHSGNGHNVADTQLNWTKIVREADEREGEIRHVLENKPVFSLVAFTSYRFFNLFCRLFMRLEVRNVERLREMKRPFLICPNHQSFLDPFVLCSNYSYDFFRSTFHVGASEFFQNSFMRWLSRKLNVVPIDPDTQLMKAMKAGATGLKHGKILNIYPEGERAFDGELHDFKKGAAILAHGLELPILPVAMDGLYKVWPRKSWRIRPAKVTITIGEPFYTKDIVKAPSHSAGGFLSEPGAVATGLLRHNSELSDDETYEAITAHLKETIAAMIDEMRNG